MKFNIASVLKNEGSAMALNGSIDPCRLEYLGNEFDFRQPLILKGVLRNIGGTFEITGNLYGEYVSRCDKCAAEITGNINVPIDETVDGSFSDSDGDYVLTGSVLDISGLINALIWGNLPMRVLCREDCKGLCRVCGCNLNETVCDCEQKE